MEVDAACEIARLPEELLSAALSLTTPRDACRAAAVSRAFRAAADSDAVWSCFLPPLLPDDGELPLPPPPPRRKKDLYLRLSASPVLLQDGLLSMWLDKETAAKCYMVSARALSVIWPRYWSWIPLADSRFSESANLKDVCWLDIHGKIHIKMLSQGLAYAVYMVYKLADHSYGLNWPLQEASIEVGGTNHLTRKVCLDHDSGHAPPREEDGMELPLRRVDGWIELKLGEFTCQGDEDGDVSFGLKETEYLNSKGGLIVQGIEIRCIRNNANEGLEASRV